MALVISGSLLFTAATTFLGGPVNLTILRENYDKLGRSRNRFFGDSGLSKIYGVPVGYRPPYTWSLAPIDGGLASYREIKGEGSLLGFLNGGYPTDATISASGAITLADLGLIVSGVMSATGLITITGAPLKGILFAQALLSGAIDIVNNNLGAEVGGQALMTGAINASSIVLRANAFMGAAITQTETVDLSVEEIARAVWEANPSLYNDPASFGKLLKQIKGLTAAGL